MASCIMTIHRSITYLVYLVTLLPIISTWAALIANDSSVFGSHAIYKFHSSDIHNLSSLTFIQRDSLNPGKLLGIISNSVVEISLVAETIYTLLDLDLDLDHLTKAAKPTSLYQLQNGDILIVDNGLKCVRQLQRFNMTVSTQSGLCNDKKPGKPVFDFCRTSQNGRDGDLLYARYMSPKDISSGPGNFSHLFVTDHQTIRQINMVTSQITTVTDVLKRSGNNLNRLSISHRLLAVGSSNKLFLFNMDTFAFKFSFSSSCRVQPCLNSYKKFRISNRSKRALTYNKQQVNSFSISGSFSFESLVLLSERYILAVRSACDSFMCSIKRKSALWTLIVVDTELKTIKDVCPTDIDWPRNSFCSDKGLEPFYVTMDNGTLYVAARKSSRDRIMIFTVQINDLCIGSGSEHLMLGSILSHSPSDISCNNDLEQEMSQANGEFPINRQVSTTPTFQPIMIRNSSHGDSKTKSTIQAARLINTHIKTTDTRPGNRVTNNVTSTTNLSPTTYVSNGAPVKTVVVKDHPDTLILVYAAPALLLAPIIIGTIVKLLYQRKNNGGRTSSRQSQPAAASINSHRALPVPNIHQKETSSYANDVYDEIDDEMYDVISDSFDEPQTASLTETMDKAFGNIVYVNHPTHIERVLSNQEPSLKQNSEYPTQRTETEDTLTHSPISVGNIIYVENPVHIE